MARIPLQIAERSLDTGGVVNYPQGGGPIGEAVSGFGQALEGVADRYAAMKLREDTFDAQIAEQELENELDRADMDAAANAAPDGTGLHDTMYGQLDPQTGAPRKPGAFDNIFDKFAQRIPASQRQRFLEQKEAKRGRRSVRMAGVQLTRRREYETVQLDQKKQDLLNEIMQTDPDDKEAYASIVKRFEDMAIASSKDALDKEVDIIKMKEDAAIALGAAMEKRDPTKLKALLGMADPAAATSVYGSVSAGGGAGGGGGAVGAAAAILRKEEGFRETPYWDVNHDRIGYGSDTMTMPDGTVRTTVKGARVSREDAERDLARRAGIYARQAADAVRTDAWARLPDTAKGAIISVMYNYGHLPGSVVHAIRSGDRNRIAAAVEGLGSNPGRRKREAAIIRGGAVPAGGPTLVSGPAEFVPQEVDPRFEALSFEQRIAMANRADASIRDQMALLKGSLETIINNAPTAIQNTGRYDGMMPTQEHFIGAYGAQEGPQRWRAFDTAVQTAQQVHSMQTMPNGDIAAMVEQATPTSSGDNAELETARYTALSNAAAEVAKARKDDISGYVQRAFPSVSAMWDKVRQPGATSADYQAAIAANVAAQRQLGVAEADIMPITKGAGEAAINQWKNEGAPQETRAAQVATLMQSTPDPQQRKAIFEQLVEAGLPDMAQGAFLALERGDQGAYNRLLNAAMTDVSKLPGTVAHKPAAIDSMIEDEILGEGKVGDVVYGMTIGGDNAERGERDGKLISNAVQLELRRNGGDLKKAVRSVAKDLYGDVQVVTGNRRVNVKALIPAGEDADAFLASAETMMPQVGKHLEWLMSLPDEVPQANGTLAVYSNALPGYGEEVRNEGVLLQSGDGFVFWDPYANGAIPGPDGRPMIFKPIAGGAVLEARRPAAPDATVPGVAPIGASPSVAPAGIEAAPVGDWMSPLGAAGASPAPAAPVTQSPLPGDVPSSSQRLIDDMEASGRNLTGGAAAGKRDRLTPSGSIPMPGNR